MRTNVFHRISVTYRHRKRIKEGLGGAWRYYKPEARRGSGCGQNPHGRTEIALKVRINEKTKSGVGGSAEVASEPDVMEEEIVVRERCFVKNTTK